MATKDITDIQVCEAYKQYRETFEQNLDKMGRNIIVGEKPPSHLKDYYSPYPYEILQEMTGEPEKVCYRAMERAERRGYIEYGVSLRCGWLTKEGKILLGLEEE